MTNALPAKFAAPGTEIQIVPMPELGTPWGRMTITLEASSDAGIVIEYDEVNGRGRIRSFLPWHTIQAINITI